MKLKNDVNLADVVFKVGLTPVNDVSFERTIQAIYSGDLLSMVMGKADEESLWITVQTHVNSIAVAEMMDFSGIVFVEGLMPDEDALKKANELSLPLFTTTDDACQLIQKLVLLGIE